MLMPNYNQRALPADSWVLGVLVLVYNSSSTHSGEVYGSTHKSAHLGPVRTLE